MSDSMAVSHVVMGAGFNVFGFCVPAVAALLASAAARGSRDGMSAGAAFALALLPGLALLAVAAVPVYQALEGNMPLTWRGIILWRVAPLISLLIIARAAARSFLRRRPLAALKRLALPPSGRLGQLAQQVNLCVYELPGETTECFVAGMFAPAAYLTNATLKCLDDRALTAALVHEREHIRRHDLLAVFALRFLEDMTFGLLSPAVDTFVQSIEQRADRAAARETNELDIAEAILRLAKNRSGLEPYDPHVLALSRPGAVATRLEALLESPTRSAHIVPLISICVSAAALAWAPLQDALLPFAMANAQYSELGSSFRQAEKKGLDCATARLSAPGRSTSDPCRAG